jgi:hypothetical protein
MTDMWSHEMRRMRRVYTRCTKRGKYSVKAAVGCGNHRENKKVYWVKLKLALEVNMGATSAVSSVANSNSMTLDQALKEAAERIEAGSKIVPLNFNSPPR